jgi:hypothetical protein
MYIQSEYQIGSALPTIESPLTRTTPFLFTCLHASLVNAGSVSGSETTRKPLVFLVPLPSSQLETLHSLGGWLIDAAGMGRQEADTMQRMYMPPSTNLPQTCFMLFPLTAPVHTFASLIIVYQQAISPCAWGLHLIDGHFPVVVTSSWVPEMIIVLCHCHVVRGCSFLCFLKYILHPGILCPTRGFERELCSRAHCMGDCDFISYSYAERSPKLRQK